MQKTSFFIFTILFITVLSNSKGEQCMDRDFPKPHLDHRIVGGHVIDIERAPYVISIQRESQQCGASHHCGGSIINPWWILTAAHCTSGIGPESFTVRTGSSTHDNNGTLIQVSEIHEHANFSYRGMDYDYALLLLEEPINYDETKKAIILPKQNEFIKDKASCLVSGWGNTQNSTESKKNLREALVPVYNQTKCSESYKKYGGVTSRMLCAGYEKGGKDSCQGDSGGPLVCKGKLFGIVSWGFGCAQPSYPGIYSRVPFVRDWIQEITGI